MTSRDDRGLQAALILFVMATVVLAIATYVYFRQSHEKTNELAVATKARSEATRAFNAENARVQVLRHLVGEKRLSDAELAVVRNNFPPGANLQEIEDAFHEDAESHGKGLSSGSLHYRGMLHNLDTAIHDRNALLSDAAVREVRLVDERDRVREDERRRLAEVTQALHEALADQKREREKHGKDRARLEAEKNELAGELARRTKAMADLTTTYETEVVDLRDRLRRIELLYQAAIEKIEKSKGAPLNDNEADGEIVWVNGRTGTVKINLGSGDGLRRQTTFSVVDKRAAGATDETIKGRIEVTHIEGEHLAEARILADNPTDPILPGDKIYSPAWQKGYKLRFALTGLLDIDGDGASDRTKLKSIIATVGGIVDAELLDDGTIAGKMTLATHYLIMGVEPTEDSSEPFRGGNTEITEQASRLGVRIIPLDKFLQRAGFQP